MCFIKSIRGILSSEDKLISKLNNVLAMIKFDLDDISWAGYYWYDEEENYLYLGSFQGKIACSRIDLNKGVVGKSFFTDKTIVVKDVSKFEGHIACDNSSKSEIVIPIHKDGKVIGVLDLDSYKLNRFNDESVGFYKEIVKEIEKNL